MLAILLGAPPAIAAPGPAALCPAGSQVTTIWTGDFENGAGGWGAQLFEPAGRLAGGTSAGQLAGSHWHLPASGLGGQPWRGTGNAWADTFPGGEAPSVPADSALSMAADVTLPADTRLTFVHRFNFDAGVGETGTMEQAGAGVVEYSVDGGVTWNDVAPAGGSSLFAGAAAGGYNGVARSDLPAEIANPLAGRAAFVGRSSDDLQYRSSHLDLSALAGQRMRLRFRVATAALPGAEPPAPDSFRGWALDDVHFYGCGTGPEGPAAPGSSPLPVGNDRSERQLSGAPFVLTVTRRPRILRPRTRDRLRLLVSNAQPRAVRRVRICFRAARRLLAGNRCTRVKRLPGHATAEIAFPVRVLRPAARRNWIRVGFAAKLRGSLVAKTARRYRVGPPPKTQVASQNPS